MHVVGTTKELTNLDLMVVIHCLEVELDGLEAKRAEVTEMLGKGVVLDAYYASIARLVSLIDHFDAQIGGE